MTTFCCAAASRAPRPRLSAAARTAGPATDMNRNRSVIPASPSLILSFETTRFSKARALFIENIRCPSSVNIVTMPRVEEGLLPRRRDGDVPPRCSALLESRCRSGDASSPLEAMAEFGKHILEVDEIRQDIAFMNIAHRADADHLSRQLVAGSCDDRTVLFIQPPDDRAAVQAGRHIEYGNRAREPHGAGEGGEPDGRRPCTERFGKAAMAGKDRRNPFVVDHPQRLMEPLDQ